jgi:hypothetical protein
MMGRKPIQLVVDETELVAREAVRQEPLLGIAR